MPNTKNFETDIIELSSLYPKYSVSRIIANKSDDLLDMEIPAEFSETLLNNNIEINLYSSADNSLIFSDVVKNISGSIFTETLQYNDNTLRKLLYIDFSKVTPNLLLPSGQYVVSLNFFQDELGSYNDRILKVNKISTSRTEVELKLIDSTKQDNLKSFVTTQIPAQYIQPVIAQIFNQPNSIEIPMSDVQITTSSVITYLDSGSTLRNLGFTEDTPDGTKIGVNTLTQNILDKAYTITINQVKTDVSAGTASFDSNKIYGYVTTSLKQVYTEVLSDEVINAQRYRFDLI